MAEQIRTSPLRGWLGSGQASVPDDREDRLLPWRSVRDIAGISRTTAWRMQQTGDFPRPVAISAKRVGWWESELTAWKARRRSAIQPLPKLPKSDLASPRRPERSPIQAVVRAEPEPVAPVQAPPQKAVRRRGRPRPVSPDQIDFGF